MIDPKNIRWDELTFSLTPTRSMYSSTCKADGEWKSSTLQPFGNISLSPAACVLNYGQGLFEGLKLYSHKDGKTLNLFRPEENAARLALGCQRLCMPPVPKDLFMEAILAVAKDNKDYTPPYREGSSSQGALYIRPTVWGTAPLLGVAPSSEYTFMVFCSPVGPYFKTGFKPIKLKIAKEYHRSAPGCTGGVKAIGNYAGGMLPAKKAKSEGYQEVLYLDALENKYLEEVGAANFFCIKGNTLITPSLEGSILPGITRKSLIHLAKERLGMAVEERKISYEEVFSADEAFATGTAAVISSIGLIHYEGKDHIYCNGEVGAKTKRLYDLLTGIQHGLEPDLYGWLHRLE